MCVHGLAGCLHFHVLAPHNMCSCIYYLQRGVCFMRDDVLLGAHHLAFNSVFFGIFRVAVFVLCLRVLHWGEKPVQQPDE